MSAVEQTLFEDPAGVYGRMDFATRDQYRHIVEKIAKSSLLSEIEVARAVIDLAGKDEGKSDDGDRENHVGFYLMDKGLALLERRAGVRLSCADAIRRVIHRFPLSFYLGHDRCAHGNLHGCLLAEAHSGELRGPWVWLTAIVSLLGVSQLAIAWSTGCDAPCGAHPLPPNGFFRRNSSGIVCLVVVPTMITSAGRIDHLMEALEVRFLANTRKPAFCAAHRFSGCKP